MSDTATWRELGSPQDVAAALIGLYEQRGGRMDGPRPDGRAAAAAGAGERVAKTLDENPVVPRTRGQQRYVELVQRFDIMFAIGPAG